MVCTYHFLQESIRVITDETKGITAEFNPVWFETTKEEDSR